jgi:hypothetical protein
MTLPNSDNNRQPTSARRLGMTRAQYNGPSLHIIINREQNMSAGAGRKGMQQVGKEPESKQKPESNGQGNFRLPANSSTEIEPEDDLDEKTVFRHFDISPEKEKSEDFLRPPDSSSDEEEDNHPTTTDLPQSKFTRVAEKSKPKPSGSELDRTRNTGASDTRSTKGEKGNGQGIDKITKQSNSSHKTSSHIANTLKRKNPSVPKASEGAFAGRTFGKGMVDAFGRVKPAKKSKIGYGAESRAAVQRPKVEAPGIFQYSNLVC